MEEENKKTIEDELETYQHVNTGENIRTVSIYLDDDGDKQVDIQFGINDEGEYQLK